MPRNRLTRCLSSLPCLALMMASSLAFAVMPGDSDLSSSASSSQHDVLLGTQAGLGRVLIYSANESLRYDQDRYVFRLRSIPEESPKWVDIYVDFRPRRGVVPEASFVESLAPEDWGFLNLLPPNGVVGLWQKQVASEASNAQAPSFRFVNTNRRRQGLLIREHVHGEAEEASASGDVAPDDVPPKLEDERS